jgi:type I restriction enzyme S subunit
MREGWTYKKLGEVCEIYQPKTISKKDCLTNGDYLVYGANGVIGTYNEYNHENSEVLLGCRGTVGNVIVSKPYSWINGNAMVIHPKNTDLLQFFLAYQLRGIDLSSVITGVAQPQITRQALSPTIIAIPPISIQQQIVSELDMLSSVIEKQKAQIEELDKLAQSIFYDMFGDPVENEKGWEVKKLGVLCEIGTGATPSRTKENLYYGGNIPWVKTTEVCYQDIYDTEEKITPLAIKETNCKVYPVGTLLMAMYGQGKTRGQVAKLMVEAATNQACAAIQVDNKNIHIDYLYALMLIEYDSIRAMAQGGNQANLNMKLVGSIPVPLPPLSLQQEFADKIQAIESMKVKVRQSLKESETLFNSRMDFYFS